MKKIVLSLGMASICFIANALSLDEAFEKIQNIPDLPGVYDQEGIYHSASWVENIPFQNSKIVTKYHEVGKNQTLYYGEEIHKIYSELPRKQLYYGYIDKYTSFYIYGKEITDESTQILIIIDAAQAGKTTAILGNVHPSFAQAMRAGHLQNIDNVHVFAVPVLFWKW